MEEPIIPCICLTCGVRNDFTNPTGFCQNGHDDWLEEKDVIERNEWFDRALVLTGLSASELHDAFMDIENKYIKIIPIKV